MESEWNNCATFAQFQDETLWTKISHWHTGVILLNFAISCLTEVCVLFLAGDSICAIAHYMPSPLRPSISLSVRLSVSPSVTWMDQLKTVKVRIMQLSPHSSPMALVSWRLISPWNSKAKIGSGAPNDTGRKNMQFSANRSQYLRNCAR